MVSEHKLLCSSRKYPLSTTDASSANNEAIANYSLDSDTLLQLMVTQQMIYLQQTQKIILAINTFPITNGLRKFKLITSNIALTTDSLMTGQQKIFLTTNIKMQ